MSLSFSLISLGFVTNAWGLLVLGAEEILILIVIIKHLKDVPHDNLIDTVI